MKTAYVDAVATNPAHEGRGCGSAVMRRLAIDVEDDYTDAWKPDKRRSTSASAGSSGAAR
jgi:hypothetical protein